MNDDARDLGRQIIAHHSKSFALASRLLPEDVRDRAVVVYAWCRRADDAVDLAPAGTSEQALATLRSELDAVYGDAPLDDPILAAFRHVTRTRRIPRHYPQELLEGLAMDTHGTHYDDMPRLLLYCYRVAGVVGLMMCHVMGVRREEATRNATHLGVAMQLTNICRDVEEDWQRGRLYLPAGLMRRHGGADLRPPAHAGLRRSDDAPLRAAPIPQQARVAMARTTAELLDVADTYYASGNDGIPALSWRCALAVRTASKVYAAIGDRVRAQGCDPLAGRAWVSGRGKLARVASAVVSSLSDPPRARTRRITGPARLPEHLVRAEDVLPLDGLPIESTHAPAAAVSPRRSTRIHQGAILP
jgi:phytoene synthase